MTQPHTLILDFDGVLTDGKINMASDGKTLFKSMHVRDTMAIRELVARGWVVMVVTASECDIIYEYCRKLGIVRMIARDKGGLVSLLEKEKGAFKFHAVGDSSLDLPLFAKAERSFCPADASHIAKAHPGIHILQTEGGKGVVEELLHLLTQNTTT